MPIDYGLFYRTELMLSKGAQKFLEISLENMTDELKAEALSKMPFLEGMCQKKRKDEDSFTNSQLAVAFASFRENNRAHLSQELLERIDAWAIAISGMARPRRNSKSLRTYEEANEFVSRSKLY